jgi:NAD-dependent SIR2 family protein deacetylase
MRPRTLSVLAKMRHSHFPWRLALSSTTLISAWLPSRLQLFPSASSLLLAPLSTTTTTTTTSVTASSSRFFAGKSDSSCDGETLERLIEKLIHREFQNIVLLIGAGASVSAGIPDFRTPGTGLYDRLQHFHLPYPEAIFDLDYYKIQPKPFVELCQEIWPGKEGTIRKENIVSDIISNMTFTFIVPHFYIHFNTVLLLGGARPTLAHAFCKVLEDQGMLRRIYTQNIDGLEALAGIDTAKLVECHGNFRSCSCIRCKSEMRVEDCRHSMVERMEVPLCSQCGAYVKPDIVFFGEELPVRFHQLVDSDTDKADLLIVMGTSLMVMPVASIPSWVRRDCPRILLNRERVGNFLKIQSRDVFVEGDCDDGVREICRLAGWETFLDEQYQNSREP